MKTTKMIFNLTVMACLLLGGTLHGMAQQKRQSQQQQNQVDVALRQEIREKAMQTIQRGYERYATCRTADEQQEFVKLFTTEEAPVYNDLLGLSKAATLTAESYAKLLGGGVNNTIVNISGISILDDPYQENGTWKIDVAMNKRIAYYDNCGVSYNSHDFYNADYNLELVMQYDEVDKVCRIESIKGNIDSYSELPNQYFVFKQSDNRDRNLLYNNTPLRFNSAGQAIIEGTYNPDAFSHADPWLRQLTPEVDDCNIVTMSYGKKRKKDNPVNTPAYSILLKPYLGVGMGSTTLNGLTLISDEKKKYGEPGDGELSAGVSFGVDVGFRVAGTESMDLNLFTGLGFSTAKLSDMTYSRDYSYNGAGPDMDNDTYTRTYTGLDMEQEMPLTFLNIPIYADVQFNLGSDFSLYADLGLRLGIKMGGAAELKNSSVNSVTGKYAYTPDGITLNSEWNSDYFYKGALKNATVADAENVNSFVADLMIGAGLRYNIPNSPVAIDLGLSYLNGLTDVVKDGDTEDFKLVTFNHGQYNNGTVTGHGETVSSLTDAYQGAKLSHLRINIGVVFKF